MSLHWYACISTNTCCFEMNHISLETNWWALSNASSIVWIRSAVHEILADKAFTATDGLISQSFVVAFVHLAYVRIALIWGFPAQLSLWKSVHWLWRYKLNEVCDMTLASAYVLHHLFVVWLQLQMIGRSLRCWSVCHHWTPEIEFNYKWLEVKNVSIWTSSQVIYWPSCLQSSIHTDHYKTGQSLSPLILCWRTIFCWDHVGRKEWVL